MYTPHLRPFPFPPSPKKQAPLNSARGLGSAVSSPSGVWGTAPAEIEFGAFRHLVATVLTIFPKLYQTEKSQPKYREDFSRFLVCGRARPISRMGPVLHNQ